MSRERYVRAVVKAGDVELIAGLAFRNGERIDIIRLCLRNLMREELAKMPDGLSQDDWKIAENIERRVARLWPGRPFFLECGYQAETEGWVQVFEPYGAPLSMVGRLRKRIGW